MLAALPTSLRLVIITQFAFNVGFYLVVPFIAAHLAKDLLLAEWIIGLLLGLRTFSQQGMFFLGGALADRFGIKSAILIGCAIRICGFLALAIADEVFGVMVGVILIGFAAAGRPVPLDWRLSGLTPSYQKQEQIQERKMPFRASSTRT